MPASSSSPISPVIDQLQAVGTSLGDDLPDALTVLNAIGDTRRRRGVRHQLAAVLGLALCAVLAGARSFVAIAEWAADADRATLARLGIWETVPCESTFRRVLQSLDAQALDDSLGEWSLARSQPVADMQRVIAIDGKTLRGSARGDEPGRHLLAAFDHTHGVVLGQVDVEAKTNEIPMFSTLLDPIPLVGAVVTADAMHAQRAHADYLHGRGAHFVFTVKRNQPKLHAQLAGLPWRDVPVGDLTRDRGHGRIETRQLKVTAVSIGLLFPHAAQAIQIRRRRRSLTSNRWSTETVYAVTSLTPRDAGPQQLADIVRGHWKIEDQLHWVRDVTFDEDRSQIRTCNGPRVMATLRNLAISVLRLTGATNIAAALRYHARRPHRPLQTIMTC